MLGLAALSHGAYTRRLYSHPVAALIRQTIIPFYRVAAQKGAVTNWHSACCSHYVAPYRPPASSGADQALRILIKKLIGHCRTSSAGLL